jgi:hypothetical protein
MHRVFEVSYDLRTVPKPNYDALYAELKSFNGWYHVLESMWFVYSDLDAAGVYNRICRHLRSTDYTWVTEVGDQYTGWLPKGAWDWLAAVRDQTKRSRVLQS